MSEFAIKIESLCKGYRLYNKHLDRVKETFHPFRRKYHRIHHALRDISLEIEPGEFVGIIGRNGSGKSTLLQIISGVLQKTSGHVEVNGTTSALLELGAGFNPEFSGRENVYLNASILGISKANVDRQFTDIEAFADIGTFIDQPVKTYSSGMYVRLAFAVAISVRPQILIVDEALAVGDIFFQQKCIRYMEEEMKNCTKVLVTHDMHAVMNLCNRVYVLEQGRLGFYGSPIESVEYYTKVMQNELFRSNGNMDDTTNYQPINNHDQLAIQDTRGEGWVYVDEEDRAGASEIEIIKVRLISGLKKQPVMTALHGDLLRLEMVVESSEPLGSVLFGYILKDRVGNGICGDNTLSMTTTTYDLGQGRHLVALIFKWPDIAPDNYLMTLGVGQGDHPLHHVIQCWAHNILNIKGLSEKDAVHGIFTNPIIECEVRAVD